MLIGLFLGYAPSSLQYVVEQTHKIYLTDKHVGFFEVASLSEWFARHADPPVFSILSIERTSELLVCVYLPINILDALA